MSVREVEASTRSEVAPLIRGGVRGFADRWPFRRKLNVLVGVPLVVVALLLAYVIAGLAGQAQDSASAARLVRDSRQVAELVDLVETEHQQALLLSVRYESATSGARPSLNDYRKARAAVDAQVAKVRSTFGSRLPMAEAQVLKEIEGLATLRTTIEQSYLPADNIDPAYTSTVDELIDGLGLDLNGNLASTRTGSLLDSLLRAEAAHSSFETSVFSARTGDTNALIEFVDAVGHHRLYAYQTDRFGRFATDEQRARLAGIEQGPAWNAISLQYAGLQIDPSGLVAKNSGQVRAAFTTALQSYPQYQQEARTRLAVTGSLIDQIADRADRLSDEAWWRAVWLLVGALLAFSLWLALSVAIRRSVVRPVQVLTGAAAQVAEVAGQELARVADDDADAGPPRLREVPVVVRDEIGDLAEAFNRVQNTAAALLERQVLSRRNVAEMFGNVGRRVSNLTARQLTLIDALERGETDPALLDRLYRVDHLAVRLQRNADSLMLLAGIRETGQEAGPTSLTNVVRAALGQIEGYQRVSLQADTDVTVAPDIIADLTLMLAELLENAVSFSPARSPVEVAVRSVADGALIEVADHGLGMSAERLAEENARLIRRERLDLVPTRVLGLFVVGRLARRWGVGVTLTRSPGGGVTVRVTIPSSLLLLMSPFAVPGNESTGSRSTGNGSTGSPGTGGSGTGGTSAAVSAGDRSAPAERGGAVAVGEARPAAASAGAGTLTSAEAAAPADVRTGNLPRRRTAAPSPAGPDEAVAPGGSSSLPRRVPGGSRPADGPVSAPASGAAPAADPRPGPGTPAADAPEEADGEAGRTLHRRVRGATLRTTVGGTDGRAAHQAPSAADADEVRSELDEFEAAVERANRDSAGATAPSRTTTDTAGQPEGAEQ